MVRYKNFSKQSWVYAYEIGTDFIKVQFRSGIAYLYTYASTGKTKVEKLKWLAERGRGLNSYINEVVKKDYASKGYL